MYFVPQPKFIFREKYYIIDGWSVEFVFIIIEFDLGSSLPFAFPWEFVKCQWDFVVAYVPIRFHGLKFREGAKFSKSIRGSLKGV